ncbi:MAG: LytR C-terminal domain-containing protein [candidate division WOR-3 bacterium]|nr:LytR C-terminal domain-containing protein [candidate division WOR-3 bacterium]
MSPGRVGLLILMILLFLFGASVIYMRTREDPEEIFKRNSNLRVEVLNGCGVNRLAIRVSDILREKGFNVVSIGDAKNHYPESVVIERADENMTNGKYFARRINCKNIGKDIDPALFIDVTLIVGEDYKKLFPDVEKRF